MSTQPFPDADRIERRLTELEIKASYGEDLLERLNDIIVRQQAQLDALAREVVELRRQREAGGGAPEFRSLRDELPPHY